MRDQRLIAIHRGGLLNRSDHFALAKWASECAETVLPFFARISDDARPLQALEVARAWANGKVSTGAAMKAAVAAHASAREAIDKAAMAAARAAAHAVATAHAADHCLGALIYVLKSFDQVGSDLHFELRKQLHKLPVYLREPVEAGVVARLPTKLRERLRSVTPHGSIEVVAHSCPSARFIMR